MNRCLLRLALASSLLFALCGAVAAQSVEPRIPPMNAKAISGVMLVTAPPVVMLDGKPERLAPGARIRAQNNLIVLSATLVGQPLPVRYVRDTLGLLQEVWILTNAEALAFPPTQASPATTP